MFQRPPDELAEDLELTRTSLQVPVIDFNGVGNKGSPRRKNIVEQVKHASETWGFFQVVNHGIPMNVLEEMLKVLREFHEQDIEAKKEYYTRDPEKMVRFNTNYDLYLSRAANWRAEGHYSPPLSDIPFLLINQSFLKPRSEGG